MSRVAPALVPAVALVLVACGGGGGADGDEDHDATVIARGYLLDDGIIGYHSRDSRMTATTRRGPCRPGTVGTALPES